MVQDQRMHKQIVLAGSAAAAAMVMPLLLPVMLQVLLPLLCIVIITAS